MRQENIKKITDPRQVPYDLSDEEQLEFWETHEITEEFLAKTEEVPADERPRRRERTKPISLRLDESKIERLKAIAEMRDTGYQTLIKEFITERLYEEEKRIGLLSSSSDLAPTVQINESEQAQQQQRALLEQAQRQQEAGRALAQESVEAYAQFLNTPASHFSQQAHYQVMAAKQAYDRLLKSADQDLVQAAHQAYDQALESADQDLIRAVKQAHNQLLELVDPDLVDSPSVSDLQIEDYEKLSVTKITELLDTLSTQELQRVRSYEEHINQIYDRMKRPS